MDKEYNTLVIGDSNLKLARNISRDWKVYSFGGIKFNFNTSAKF